MKLRAILALSLLLAAFSRAADACTVCFIFDGKLALAGDNEDWFDDHTQLWFVPATADSHGIIYFGYGAGEYPAGGIQMPKIKEIPEGGFAAIKTADIYGFPQAGMNDQGLFFGGAATDTLKELPPSDKKKYDGFLFDLVLRKCATVEEALKLLAEYDGRMSQGQILLADKTGASVILEAGGDILRKNGNCQVITNFRQSQVKPAEISCDRYKKVDALLRKADAASIELVRNALLTASARGRGRESGETLTQYSTIYDLTHGDFYVYHQGNFARPVKLNLRAELARGQRAVRIVDLFKKSPG